LVLDLNTQVADLLEETNSLFGDVGELDAVVEVSETQLVLEVLEEVVTSECHDKGVDVFGELAEERLEIVTFHEGYMDFVMGEVIFEIPAVLPFNFLDVSQVLLVITDDDYVFG
jgi:hypothetical protein